MPIENYPEWMSDGSIRKYVRAMEMLRKEGIADPSEEAVKALYVRWGGKVLEVEAAEEEEVEAAEEEEVEVRPRRGRPSARE